MIQCVDIPGCPIHQNQEYDSPFQRGVKGAAMSSQMSWLGVHTRWLALWGSCLEGRGTSSFLKKRGRWNSGKDAFA